MRDAGVPPPYLGSIKGGKARKHIIYRPNVGGWWVAGPLEDLEAHQAWERLRHELVQAITAAVGGDVDDFERFPLLRWGPALVTKTLAIYAPDRLPDTQRTRPLSRGAPL